MYKAYYDSPIGIIEVVGTQDEIVGISFDKKCEYNDNVPDVLKQCIKELDEYFKGTRKEFTVKIKMDGTEFQKKVWNALSEIPYGETVSYKDIACAIENPKAVRAVGGANNKNKLPLIIPCHRVIGANGALVGYGEGLWRKGWLLKHESNCPLISNSK